VSSASDHDWHRLPVDDVGYIHPSEVLAMEDEQLRRWVANFEHNRYRGWRNHANLWRDTLGLDKTRGKHILDFGCGFGIEALQFAPRNRLTLYDLTDEGLEAAAYVLAVHGFVCDTTRDELPEADIFYANGSLHHTPNMPQILADAPCPEARIMVYSDKAEQAVGGSWRAMDEVGGYCDFYSPERLDDCTPGWNLREWHYITDRDWYLTATLDRV
jgi:SAM-dependent methyltransferase